MTYSDLKLMIERVRGCKYDANGNEITSNNNNNNNNGLVVPFNGASAETIDQPAAEDFIKLDNLIEQLTDRWNAAVNLYSQRCVLFC